MNDVRDTPTVADIVINAMNDKPVEAADAMHSVMLDKIRERLEGKRQELVNVIHNDDDDEKEPDDEEYDDEEEEFDEEDEDFEDEDTDEDTETNS